MSKNFQTFAWHNQIKLSHDNKQNPITSLHEYTGKFIQIIHFSMQYKKYITYKFYTITTYKNTTPPSYLLESSAISSIDRLLSSSLSFGAGIAKVGPSSSSSESLNMLLRIFVTSGSSSSISASSTELVSGELSEILM